MKDTFETLAAGIALMIFSGSTTYLFFRAAERTWQWIERYLQRKKRNDQ